MNSADAQRLAEIREESKNWTRHFCGHELLRFLAQRDKLLKMAAKIINMDHPHLGPFSEACESCKWLCDYGDASLTSRHEDME